MLLCAHGAPAVAQTGYPFRLYTTADERPTIEHELQNFRIQFILKEPDTLVISLPDSMALAAIARDLLQHFRKKSFLSASIDSLYISPSGASARLHLGPAMRWVSLQAASDTEKVWMEAAGFREKIFTGKPLRYEVLLALEQKMLEQAENNGFPFAGVWLDSVKIQADGSTSGLIRLALRRYFTFKALKINGDVKLPAAYLPNYLGVQAGSPYSRAKVLRLREQLRTLPFIETTGNPTVSFAGGEATVNLFLQKKKAGRFDFIVGLLPQPNKPEGGLLLTGSLNAAFQNALNLGERLSVEFERLKPETQRLEAQAGVPYLFGTPFGAAGRLSIFRRDSTWVDAQGDLGVEYLFMGGDFVRFFWENKSSSLQKVDTLTVLQTRRLPANLDLRQNGFGLETTLNRLDYRFNPRRGWSVSLKGVAGFNNVLRNNQIENLRLANDPSFNFAGLYDSIAGRATRFRAEIQAAVYLPFLVRSTLKIAVRGGGIFSDKPVFNNEQYRLGGNKLLRGFDEESLFATRFVVTTAELRLLLGLNSFMSAFTDYGYLENITNRSRVFLRPLGLGVGMNFETKAGIFGISIAVGRTDTGQNVDFRAAKFHLGYVSLF